MDERVVVDFKEFADNHQQQAEVLEDTRDMLRKRNPKKGNIIAKARGTLLGSKSKSRRRRQYPDDSDFEDDVPDPDEDTDIMEFKAYKSFKEAKGVDEPNLRDLRGLAKGLLVSLSVLMEDFELLFPALVPAFSLKDKAWRWILSDSLREMDWNRVAFESLQLKPEKKSLIQGLVKGHRNKSSSFDDVVPGKGQGLVFLLHGYVWPPRYFKQFASDSFSQKAWIRQDAYGW